eukprot:CAMPEP_0119055372 /NCGR_PEP_ID=MMETSP1177-20130426/75675_1 /TAXON_ID=2985 /ORGANISM="Ochromonas sp, Strain CCMP1899" /LENGTH=87 /DNA_ID=CAMNT_0007035881 /DNA_START=68 /DNA_END=328 /DNA_ORIENTATION=+
MNVNHTDQGRKRDTLMNELISVQETGLSWLTELSTKFKVNKNAIGSEKVKDHTIENNGDMDESYMKQRAASIDDKSNDLEVDIPSLW